MIKNINQPGYEHYFIDTDGNVYGENMKKRKLFVNKQNRNGYLQVMLQNKKMGLKPKLCYVHRLVAQTFIPNPQNLPQVNHIDYCRTNNKISNLEWVSLSEQAIHRLQRIETYPKLIERLKKDFVTFNKGIENFSKYKNFTSLSLIWNCSEWHAHKIVKKYDVSMVKYKMPKQIRQDIINEIKDYYQKTPGKNIFGKKYVEYLSSKYKVIISSHQFYDLRDKAIGKTKRVSK